MVKKKTAAGKTVKKTAKRKRPKRQPRADSTASVVLAPIVAPGSPENYRVRVRMYRQGLGDCFLLTFPRDGAKPFQALIDCGVLARDAKWMTGIVEHIRDTIRGGDDGKARLDLVVATHEHKDHLSGFNQARDVFNADFDFGAVWLGWTENLTKPEIKAIKKAKRTAQARLQAALAAPVSQAAALALDGVDSLFAFSQDDDDTPTGKIADALEYLKVRGADAKELKYLDPGDGPLKLEGVDDVRVFALGPPRDPILLKGSEVTKKMKDEGVIYHLSAAGPAGVVALSAAMAAASGAAGAESDRYHPFSIEHRLSPTLPVPLQSGAAKTNPYFAGVQPFLDETYDDPEQAWRRIDHDWLSAFGQLALDLDNDTNNTSLVLAFEFAKSQEVLLFVGDAQVGNWQSWADVKFEVPERSTPLPAHDLLSRTVFYKVGHHCSHNATLKNGGLELMTRPDLVAFIPLDQATAAVQGRKDPATGKPKGWDMPAAPLYKALKVRANNRVVLSDVNESLTPEAQAAGVIETQTYIDYFLL